jgi:AcrR family transcriptional regulator
MATKQKTANKTDGGIRAALGIDTSDAGEERARARLALDLAAPGDGQRVDAGIVGILAQAAMDHGTAASHPDGVDFRPLETTARHFAAGEGDALSAEAMQVYRDDGFATWRATVFRHTAERTPGPRQIIAEVSQSYDLTPAAPGSRERDATPAGGEVIALAEIGDEPDAPPTSTAEQRRRQIFKGACEVIIRKGYADASIREIAAAADLSIPALYQYVKSKEDILFMITNGCMEEIFHSFRDGLSATGSAAEKMSAAVENYVRYVGRNRKYINLVYRETRSLSPENRERIFALERDFTALWEEIIQAGKDSGEFEVENTDLAANLAYFMCTAWALRHWNIGRHGEDEVRDLLTRFILRGLTAN